MATFKGAHHLGHLFPFCRASLDRSLSSSERMTSHPGGKKIAKQRDQMNLYSNPG